jgi:hypothetical protein
MARPSIHTPLPRRPLGRVALAGLLALALVWSQSLGLWHRVVHRDLAHAVAAISTQQTVASEAPRASSVLERLFAGHRGDADCQFFDQHSHSDALTGVASAAVLLAALPGLLLTSHALAVARWHAQFQARGPPSIR